MEQNYRKMKQVAVDVGFEPTGQFKADTQAFKARPL